MSDIKTLQYLNDHNLTIELNPQSPLTMDDIICQLKTQRNTLGIPTYMVDDCVRLYNTLSYDYPCRILLEYRHKQIQVYMVDINKRKALSPYCIGEINATLLDGLALLALEKHLSGVELIDYYQEDPYVTNKLYEYKTKKEMRDMLCRIMTSLRIQHGYSIYTLSEKAHLHRATVTSLENGNRKPTLETLAAICKVYKMTLYTLFQYPCFDYIPVEDTEDSVPTDALSYVPTVITNIIRERKIDEETFAMQAGISVTRLNKILSYHHTIQYPELLDLCEHLNMTVSDFMKKRF